MIKIKIWKTKVILNNDNIEPGIIIEKQKQLIIKAGEKCNRSFRNTTRKFKENEYADFFKRKQQYQIKLIK